MPLRDKLKALTAPCREVDAEIACAMTASNEWPILSRNKQPKPMNKEGLIVGVTQGGTIGHIKAPHYTASLDATVDLVEREMPETWDVMYLRTFDTYSATIKRDYDGEHKLPAVALLLALLDAKEIE